VFLRTQKKRSGSRGLPETVVAERGRWRGGGHWGFRGFRVSLLSLSLSRSFSLSLVVLV